MDTAHLHRSARACCSLPCIMSLGTGTPQFSVSRSAFMLMTLAIERNRRAFSSIKLVTDERGAAIALALGWDIEIEILRFIEESNAWALPKFQAILQQPGACAHVDNDAMFIKTPPIELENAPLFAQNLDKEEYYQSFDMSLAILEMGMQFGGRAYNGGIIGGANKELLDEYCRDSIALARRVIGKGINGTTSSMACEQYHLATFADLKGVEVYTICSESPDIEETERVGWIHLHGKSKRDADNIARVEARLSSSFPSALAKFEQGWLDLCKGPEADNIRE